MILQKIVFELKKNKFLYYVKNLLRQTVPAALYKNALKDKLASIKRYDKAALAERVNYYNKLNTFKTPGQGAIRLKELRIFQKSKSYSFDTFEYTRYFNNNLKANFLFGDVVHTPDAPSIQKSRPVAGDNANAVLLKLNKKRHFLFVKDTQEFSSKKNLLIGRGNMNQPHRARFMELYFDNPLFDLGQVNKRDANSKWLKPKLSISAHLQYKFILSLEGNDVASNLKWIMSSNSIAVMPKPKYETWFMEGRLIPGYHYIQIRDDYSDAEEKINYYIAHTEEAEAIVRNANSYIRQFLNKKQEDLISLLVLEKYFYYTSQTDRLTELAD